MSLEDRDFFISHAGTDRQWAEWVAWQLVEAGYTVELAVWDWGTGENFVKRMSHALSRCTRIIALYSAAYFEPGRFTEDEWTAVMAARERGGGRLVPLRIEPLARDRVPDGLRTLLYRDLFDLPESEARRALLEAVVGPRRPDGEPVFPGRGVPGTARSVSDMPPKLPANSSHDAGGQSGDRAWTFRAAAQVHSSPAVAHGLVYVGSHDGHLYALDAFCGERRWSYFTGGPVASSPAVADGVVYVGTYDGHLCALDAFSGDKLWEQVTSCAMFASPTVADGAVYIGGEDGNLHALTTAGQERWVYFTDRRIWGSSSRIWSAPLVRRGLVAVM